MYSGRALEAIDTRLVFRVYAALVCIAGLLLVVWGPLWFGFAGGRPANAALIRVLGSMVIAAGCCAAGFAVADNPRDRRRGLFWFAVGHTVVWLVVLFQQVASAEATALYLFVVSILLFYLWRTSEGESVRGSALTSLFANATPDSDERLRSQYEQQIREAARQEERNRLARDLHDSIKQQIFVIQTAAATAQARFEEDRAGAKQALDQIRSSAREATTEMCRRCWINCTRCRSPMPALSKH
jgi:signal transduction histidine kinase